MRWLGYVTLICAVCLAGQLNAQSQKPAKKKQATEKKADKKANKGEPKKSISMVQGSKMARPTTNLDPGSVGYYFYPMTPGSYWTMRTVKSLYDLDNKLLASDTLFSTETVSTNSAASIQGLPLIKCISKSYKPGQSKDVAAAEEVTYYVDDSLIMAVFNNSITHNQNVALLTTPLREGYIWPERFEDTIVTQVISTKEPVETPAGKFENAVVTSTKLGQGELSKYFVGQKGIVKMVFQGPAAGGRGSLVVTTDLMEIHHETGHMDGSSAPIEERWDPTMK